MPSWFDSAMNAKFDEWRRRLEAAVAAAAAMGGKRCELIVEPPASESRIREIEVQLGLPLPPSFRRVLREFSAHFEISWFLPEAIEVPQPFQIFCGTLSWSLPNLVAIQAGMKGWIERVFPNPDDPYDRIWHGKLGFHEVGNGDYLALDISLADGAVTYLSHDAGQGHGYVLGSNFIDTIERLSLLGCVGAEDWQWLPFTSSPTGGLEPNGKQANRWREWFGLK